MILKEQKTFCIIALRIKALENVLNIDIII